jgi:glyoxylase-like metal-dependent hydrolase (beta-lactamase superfamily II)
MADLTAVGDGRALARWRDAVAGEPLRIAPSTTVLVGADLGKYPHGNSLLVEGPEGRLVVDPGLDHVPVAADQVLLSHCHEDHIAGLAGYADRPVAVHEADAVGLGGLDGMMQVYGFGGDLAGEWREVLVRDFHYAPRPDALTFVDGAVWDLGGGVRVTAVHLPGHTRGHTGFMVEPDGVLYLGDIDLTSFGPYYADAWSDLGAFQASMARCRELDVAHVATFHHKGVVSGRAEIVERIDAFAAAFARRDARVLELLAEPRTLEELAAGHVLYRPGSAPSFAPYAERRTIEQHLAQLVARGEVVEVGDGRFARSGQVSSS